MNETETKKIRRKTIIAIMSLIRVRPKADDEFEDAFYKSSKFLIWFGLVSGVFPVYRDSEGTFQFRWISARTFYCVFIYVVTSYAALYSTYIKVLNFFDPELPFDDYLFTLIFLVTLAPHWLDQIVSISSCKRIAEYLTTWTGFQKHFLQVTGSTIKLDYSFKYITIVSFGTVMAVLTPIAQTVMMGAFTLRESVGFFHVLTLYTYLCVWWSLQCTAFVYAVRNLRENMRKELIENPIHVDIRRYKYLWEHLYNLTEKMSISMRDLYGVYNFFTYSSLFVSVYCIISLILSSRQVMISYARLAGFVVNILYFGIHTYGFCNSAHFLEEEITHAVINDLMKLRLYRLSYRNTKEVHSFLNTIKSKKVGLVVFGNFTIGRRSLTSYAASMAMYCLVLLQFKITLPQGY